jgi:DNA invertase Pin-like site-specific DNA recombinase
LLAAIKHLDDQELDRLAAASFAELKRRGRKPPVQDETSLKGRIEDAASLTPGRLNAVRAAFRAGVTPSKIARQFGVSHSDVRKALAGILSKGAEP